MSCNNTFSNLLNVFTTNSLSAIWKIHKNCVLWKIHKNFYKEIKLPDLFLKCI